ncbi:MAG: hypothetical protein NZ551_06240 [Microscillaceae bacterium]|nr:hypothetical protein [Microscillaceae bacterium]MDW8460794.1 hypothetical protein [Cytophagales bacterium]
MRKSIDHAARIASEREKRLKNARYNKWLALLCWLLSFLSFAMYLDTFSLTNAHKIAERSIDLLTAPDTQEVFLPKFEITKKGKVHFIEMYTSISTKERNDVYVELELCDTLKRPYFRLIGDFYYDYGYDWTETVERTYDYLIADTVGTFVPKILVEKSSNFNNNTSWGAYLDRQSCNLVVRIYEKDYVEDYFLYLSIALFLVSIPILYIR